MALANHDAASSSASTPPKKKSRARKTSDKPTRIYSYRILPPEDPEHRKLVDDQFWLAHQYRGRLTEIEIELRENFRAVDLDHPLTREAYFLWEAQNSALDAAYADLRAEKSGTAPKDRDLEQIRWFVEQWKAECKRAWIGVKNARSKVTSHHKPRYEKARTMAADKKRAARGEFSAKGLMHGTYRRIEQAIERSVDSTGRPPEFERYEGEGSIGRQLPRTRDKEGRLYSVTADDLYSGADSYVRMTQLPVGWEDLPRGERRRVAKHYRSTAKQQRSGDGWQEIPARLNGQFIEMQFGWAPANRPKTWVRFPLTHHRRMPKDAEVLWMYVHRWRVGIHYEWRAQFTIESREFHRPETPSAPAQTCAIDIGWRRILDENGEQIGLRVGYLVDEHGAEREILAPDGLWQRLAKVYSIAQIRSRELDAIRDRLVAWTDGREMPAWWTERRVVSRDDGKEHDLPPLSAGLPQWRSPRKLQRLADAWNKDENRFDGDAEMLAALLAWAKQDRHLGQWEAHMRDRTIAHRREVWRQVAADLARTYRTILVEDGLCRSEGREKQMKIVDIEGWERKPPEEGDPHEGREQRRQSRMAAPGELRLAIAHASHKTASTVIDVARAKNSTRECAWCSHVQEHVDFAKSIEVCCEGCQRVWDQDANAARNLLHRRDLTSGPVPPPPGNASGPMQLGDGEALAGDKRPKSRRKTRAERRRGGDSATI